MGRKDPKIKNEAKTIKNQSLTSPKTASAQKKAGYILRLHWVYQTDPARSYFSLYERFAFNSNNFL